MSDTKTVLIVDDHASMRATLTRMVTKKGFSAESAENGLEAVDKCKEKVYDLIVLDIRMPELNGVEALAQIRELPEQPKRVMFMSAYALDELKIEAERLGYDRFLSKPLAPFDFMDILGEMLKD
jgi:CheY-like chemotaxis protein